MIFSLINEEKQYQPTQVPAVFLEGREDSKIVQIVELFLSHRLKDRQRMVYEWYLLTFSVFLLFFFFLKKKGKSPLPRTTTDSTTLQGIACN